MTQAIITKFLGPTNTRPSRVRATGWNNSVTVSYDNSIDNHYAAAQALCDKMRRNQQGAWKIIANADLPNQSGRVFIIDWYTV